MLISFDKFCHLKTKKTLTFERRKEGGSGGGEGDLAVIPFCGFGYGVRVCCDSIDIVLADFDIK